ncbi:MAG: type II toxin-antitoxin system prevent-host-death family antitoxin [Bacteroidetes bacterium]|nr:type II toxin-antitoxin system prevent-host-death family antitoxin [Bacteroidota bacterium]
MRAYNYLEAQQDFSTVLDTAMSQDVIIVKNNGRKFRITPIMDTEISSPFDVAGINTDITTNEIIEIMRESREFTIR